MKKPIGKLQTPDDLAMRIKAKGCVPRSINFDRALTVESLPQHHQDFFDRILIPQAIYEHLTIITHDRKFNVYEIDLIKC